MSAPRFQFAHLTSYNIPERTPQSTPPPSSQWASRLLPDVALHKRQQKSSLQNPREAGGALKSDKGIKEGVLEVLYLTGSHTSACFPDPHHLGVTQGPAPESQKSKTRDSFQMEDRAGSLPAVAGLALWRRNSHHPAALCSQKSTAGRKEGLVTAGHVLTLTLPPSRLIRKPDPSLVQGGPWVYGWGSPKFT